MPETITRSELETENSTIKTRLTAIQTSVGDEKREFTADERIEVDKLINTLQDNRRHLTILDAKEDFEDKKEQRHIATEPLYHTPVNQLTPTQIENLEHRQAFFDYLLNGKNGMAKSNLTKLENVRSRKSLQAGHHSKPWTVYAQRAAEDWDKFMLTNPVNEWGVINPETRDQLLVPDSAGGFLVPQGFSNELEEQMKFWGGMRRVARILTTATGNQIDWPTYDDTAALATIVGEAAAIPEQDIVFANLTLNAYKYTSGYVDVSWELLQDSFFNFETILAEAFAIRFGRGTNLHFTGGNGTTQPQGITIATNNTLNLATAGAISYADVVNLKYSVNKAYREMFNCQFMFNDEIEKFLMLLTTSEGMPLWNMSVRDGAPDTIIGEPYEINNDMSIDLTVGASKPPVMLYGALEKYLIRDVQPMTMIRLDELKALNGLVTFLAWGRFDGEFISAVDNTGDTPVKGITPPAA